MGLLERLDGLGHRIDYFPRLSAALDGDPCMAIVLQQLRFWSMPGHRSFRADDDGWVDIRAADAMRDLGMSSKVLRRCKSGLESKGLIETRQGGFPKRAQARILVEGVEQWWVNSGDQRARLGPPVVTKGHDQSRPKGATVPILKRSKQRKKKNKAAKAAPLLPGIESEDIEKPLTFEQILNGRADAATKGELAECPGRVMSPLLRRWASLWGVDPGRVRLTPQRASAWRSAIRNPERPVKPSQFAKAILGMKHDEWPDRSQYTEWTHVVKHLWRWVGLYEQFGEPPDGDLSGTKVINGVRVPSGYVWSAADVHMLNQGYRFDVKTERWVK